MPKQSPAVVPSPPYRMEPSAKSPTRSLRNSLIDFIVRSYFKQLDPSFLLTFDLNKVKDDPKVVSDTAGPETSQVPFQFVSF
jgi:hypothetical protein